MDERGGFEKCTTKSWKDLATRITKSNRQLHWEQLQDLYREFLFAFEIRRQDKRHKDLKSSLGEIRKNSLKSKNTFCQTMKQLDELRIKIELEEELMMINFDDENDVSKQKKILFHTLYQHTTDIGNLFQNKYKEDLQSILVEMDLTVDELLML